MRLATGGTLCSMAFEVSSGVKLNAVMQLSNGLCSNSERIFVLLVRNSKMAFGVLAKKR